jgi:hypothetical protein
MNSNNHSRQSSLSTILSSSSPNQLNPIVKVVPPSPTSSFSTFSSTTRKLKYLIYFFIISLTIIILSTTSHHHKFIANLLEHTQSNQKHHPIFNDILQLPPINKNYISALPIPRKPSGNPNEKFIGYLPHSGYHNQRGELANAILLGILLNRTVLLPPVWIGWPTPTEFYSELQKSWTTMVQLHSNSFNLPPSLPTDLINLPGDYDESDEFFPLKSLEEREEEERQQEERDKSDQAKWRAQGFEIRLDGVPITNLTEKECKSYSRACRQ